MKGRGCSAPYFKAQLDKYMKGLEKKIKGPEIQTVFFPESSVLED